MYKLGIKFLTILFIKLDFILTLPNLLIFFLPLENVSQHNTEIYLDRACQRALSQSHWELEDIEEKCPLGLCERGEAVSAA